jgi:hypothetical protein
MIMTTRTLPLNAPPPWRQWFDELWWVLQFADALLVLSLRAGVRGVRAIPPMARMPLFATTLGMGLGVRCVFAYLADPRPLLTILAAPVIVFGLFMLFCAWMMSGLAPTTERTAHGSVTTRRTITGKTEMTARFAPPPGKRHTPWMTARHEGGHAAAIEACGGTVVESHAYSDGSGVCKGRLPHMPKLKHRVINYMSVMVAGEVAVSSKSGCGHDQRWAKWACEKLPKAEQHDAWHRAYSMARWAQITHAATARKVATALSSTGHYKGAGGPQRYL